MTTKIQRGSKRALLVAGCALALTPAVQAQFAYNAQDAMAVFRSTTSPNLDLEVNLGPVSYFYNLGLNPATQGTTVSLGGYSTAQFNAAFPGGAVGVNWAVMSGVPVGSGTTDHPARTLWLTSPRLDLNTRTTPYQGDTASTQGSWLGTVRGIAGAGSTSGALEWSSGTPVDSITNSATAVLIPNSDPNSYSQKAGLNGDLGGTFGQGVIENGSTTSFVTERSDFYEIHPNGGDATYLGYFDFNSAGQISFTAVPEPGSLALLTLGGLGALVVIQRRRANTRS